MFLNDAIGRTAGLSYVCCHHEQSCAMAAEGYSRISGKMGVVNVTTGPGTINALNGVFGAYTDSIPMLVISGQNKRETILPTYNIPGLRQLGEQEADIVPMVRGITKYSVLVTDPESIRYHLEKAVHLAVSGRPGPTWVDIPVDVSNMLIEPLKQRGYSWAEEPDEISQAELREIASDILKRISESERPVILAGSGVRIAGALGLFEEVVSLLQIPITTAWTAHDLVASDDPLFCGRPGSVGDRPGNFTVQNADLLLVLGSRLNIRQVSYNWKDFARSAYKIQVDADKAELVKPLVQCEKRVCCDIKRFLEEILRQLPRPRSVKHIDWLRWCRERLSKYPVVTEEMRGGSDKINPYVFLEKLFRRLDPTDTVVCGNGTACVVSFQVAGNQARTKTVLQFRKRFYGL